MSESNDIPLNTSSTYPNAAIGVDLNVTCEDCTDEDGEMGVEMKAIEFDDAVEYGVVYRCPSCGKTYTLGKYGHGKLVQQLSGDEGEKAPGRPFDPSQDTGIPEGMREAGGR